MDWVYKKPEEDCPEGYHVMDDDTICVPCSRICYKNMDQFTAQNCKRICPGVFDSLFASDANTVSADDAEEFGVRQWVVIMAAAGCVLFFLAIVLAGRVWWMRRGGGRLSFWRGLSRPQEEVHKAVQVQEKSADFELAELVPSGK